MRGAGPLAVLKVLSAGPMYGYELAAELDKRTQGVLDLGQATLYPLLYNLEAKGLVESYRETAPQAQGGRERKYYRLTGTGRTKLADDTRQWQAVAGAMASLGVLEPARLALAGGAR
jgi:PadR family transcriptional regulator PadR